jgi:hypothetical protein
MFCNNNFTQSLHSNIFSLTRSQIKLIFGTVNVWIPDAQIPDNQYWKFMLLSTIYVQTSNGKTNLDHFIYKEKTSHRNGLGLGNVWKQVWYLTGTFSNGTLLYRSNTGLVQYSNVHCVIMLVLKHFVLKYSYILTFSLTFNTPFCEKNRLHYFE